MSPRPIIIHSLEHAHAALQSAAALGVPLTLQSAASAGAYAGVGWFERVIAAARAEFPDVAVTAILDCGDAPGAVMAALRWLREPGRSPLVLGFCGDRTTAARLHDMVAASGLTLIRDMEPGLDLRGAADPLAACRAWLADVAPPPPPGV